MPMWTCDFTDCNSPAVRITGDCILCNRHLCSQHIRTEFHKCPKWEDEANYVPAARSAVAEEIGALISKINTTALAARASQLRQGVPCSIAPLRYDRAKESSVMGGMNYHVEICFDDGVGWIARVRRSNATSPPPALRDYIALSEVATLQFLADRTTVPSPRVYDFALEGAHENPVGVGYILMEKLPGEPLRWCSANQEQKDRVMGQLADIYVELSRYPFDLAGSLQLPDSRSSRSSTSPVVVVGAFAREGLSDFTPRCEMRAMGPFTSWEEYHTWSLRLILDQILRGELYPQERAVDTYLIHRFLLDLVPSVVPQTTNDEKFYLKHFDDKGDHILVDGDGNITGIIDWEWAHTAPAFHAFKSPIGFLPVGDFYDGVNSLGDDEAIFARFLEERGRPDLAGYVRNGRLQHRFNFCCGYYPRTGRGSWGSSKG
ncbi:phosphotransferase enzyme family-domain-containing protein [Xylariaceae sp. FL0594]|nr:phosphotransferase enzyme family-domain-containing protein [Xylariaceae sp. FL0594]